MAPSGPHGGGRAVGLAMMKAEHDAAPLKGQQHDRVEGIIQSQRTQLTSSRNVIALDFGPGGFYLTCGIPWGE